MIVEPRVSVQLSKREFGFCCLAFAENSQVNVRLSKREVGFLGRSSEILGKFWRKVKTFVLAQLTLPTHENTVVVFVTPFLCAGET